MTVKCGIVRHGNAYQWDTHQIKRGLQLTQEVITEISPLEFDPKCWCTWTHVSGLVELLLFSGDLDAADDLLIGAGGIVLNFQYSWIGAGQDRNALRSQRIEGTYFQKTANWIRQQNLEDIYLENEHLFVSDFLALVDELTRIGTLKELAPQKIVA